VRVTLKQPIAPIDRVPIGARIALLAVVIAAVVALVARHDSSPHKGATGASARSSFLGPPGGGHGWVRSRPTRNSVVWAVGDAANGSAEESAVAAMVASNRVDRFLYLGDVYILGTAGEFASNYRPQLGRFDRIAAPTIGNHEWPNVANGYVPYWTSKRRGPPPFWYAFAVSGWQLISLNSNEPAVDSSSQLGWLGRVIERTPRYGDCRIAFMHHPFFSAGLDGDTPGLGPALGELDGHATIAISGHDHDMQRMHPVGGITQFVEGAGGQTLYPVNSEDPRLAFFDDTHHGALRLRLRPERAVLSFVAADGTILDRSTVRCSQT
jgi:hypothetical protein